MGVRHHAACFTRGTAGRRSGWNAQYCSPSCRGAAGMGAGAPRRIHSVSAAISASGRRPAGGMRSEGDLHSIACARRLSPGLPGLTAGPDRPPRSQPAGGRAGGRLRAAAPAPSGIRSSARRARGVSRARTGRGLRGRDASLKQTNRRRSPGRRDETTQPGLWEPKEVRGGSALEGGGRAAGARAGRRTAESVAAIRSPERVTFAGIRRLFLATARALRGVLL